MPWIIHTSRSTLAAEPTRCVRDPTRKGTHASSLSLTILGFRQVMIRRQSERRRTESTALPCKSYLPLRLMWPGAGPIFESFPVSSSYTIQEKTATARLPMMRRWVSSLKSMYSWTGSLRGSGAIARTSAKMRECRAER